MDRLHSDWINLTLMALLNKYCKGDVSRTWFQADVTREIVVHPHHPPNGVGGLFQERLRNQTGEFLNLVL